MKSLGLSFPGIYTITCVKTGKVYVGQTGNVRRRWGGHKWDLRKGKHRNAHLQRAWNKYGADAFIFAVAENMSSVLESELKLALDLAEVKILASIENSFNLMEAARSGNLRASDATKALLSEKRKAMWADPEIKKARSASLKETAATLEWRVRHAEILLARSNDPAWIQKMRTVNKANWKLPSSEARRKKRGAQEKAAWQDPDYRERQKKARSLAWQDPEVRAKRIAGLKAAHARRRAAKAALEAKT